MALSRTTPPPLLEPYLLFSLNLSRVPSPDVEDDEEVSLSLSPSPARLTLLTSVLGATTNWLVLWYLRAALSVTGDIGVVLVSFLRDGLFWREGGRQLGLDLPKLAVQGRFAFVDGLSGLFLPAKGGAAMQKGDEEFLIRSAELAVVYEDILGAIQTLKVRGNSQGKGLQGRKVLLIVDAVDLLLATMGMDAGAVRLGDMLMDLREHAHATILTLSNNHTPVTRQQTPLEINHATFLLSLAHQANMSLSLRVLDTGAARDVSGVLRINVREDEEVDVKEPEELLYFVAGDGGVRVFRRGQ